MLGQIGMSDPCRVPTPKIRARPTMIKERMAATLIIANQYSNSPSRLTCMELRATRGGRNHHYPNPLWNMGKPERDVDSGGDDFSADRDDLCRSIRCPN